LLLQPPETSEPLWPEVLELLCSGTRTVVPDPPTDGIEVEAWLSSLIDGLGLSNVTVVACDEYCVAALERALLEPDRIARIILVCRGRGSEGAVDGSIDSMPHVATVPILVLRRDRAAAEIVSRVRKFLDPIGDRETS
jgi:pimeloyl-ACP methyl ester carboxylesterase